MDEQLELGKLLEDGGLVCLAAYIKAEMNCTDQQAYDAAWMICDSVDTIIYDLFNDGDDEYETEE